MKTKTEATPGHDQARRVLAVLTLAAPLLLAGCDAGSRFGAAEDRINAAFPLSVDARQARERQVEQLANQSEERAALDKTWLARLRVRALSCSGDFTPSWLQSADDIRAAVKDKTCFTEFDRKLLRWVGLQRVRLMLAQPPLVSGDGASTPPSITVRGDPFSLARDAGDAPVLGVTTSDGMELIALDSGRSLFKERGPRAELSVAPNGRLFAQANQGMVRIRASDGGETLLELTDVGAVQWLGQQFLGVRSSSSSKPSYLLDLRSGDDVPLPIDASSYAKILPVPDFDKRFDVLTYRGIYQFEISDLDGKARVSLVAEKPGMDPRIATMDWGQMSTDGKEWIFGLQKLIRFDPKSLELHENSFEPVQVQGAWATAIPGQYVLSLSMRGGGGGAESRNGNYVFDSSASTLARVEGTSRQRPIRYFRSIKRLAQIEYPTIRLSESLETAAPESVDQVVAAMLDESNQRVLAQAAVEAQRMAQFAPVVAPDSPLAAVMRDAQVEGIGIYEGREKVMLPGQSRVVGKVLVNVRRSSRPVVLVLSSYEPVQWTIRLEPGARLGAVLMGGYYESNVQGAGVAQVLRMGRDYAYKSEGGEYQALQRQVQRWTGKQMGIFQSGYYGANFTVGGS